MKITGENLVGGVARASTSKHQFSAYAPAQGASLSPIFQDADDALVHEALEEATHAFALYRSLEAGVVASFLEEIGAQIIALGDDLLQRAHEETALPKERLIGERGRTVNQLKMFADVVREGSWVEAIIDRALPQRTPLSRPDLRRMLQPIGPVVVFSASNFPLAFSVAGGDTASALAARCPVIVKAHPAHPGTSELVARAVLEAARLKSIPSGVFSLLHGQSYSVGLSLVNHPKTRAVAFTGSLRGGRALFDAAAKRPAPIPVFAEMGSINPVFLLPGALQERGRSITEGLFASVTMGVGQFCTNPGLVVGLQDEHWLALKTHLFALANSENKTGSMLTPGIAKAFAEGSRELSALSSVETSNTRFPANEQKTQASATIFSTDAQTFLQTPKLSEELFGPSTLLVACQDERELLQVAAHLEGHLTATLHATDLDLARLPSLPQVLSERVGRLLFDGFPTGVEVCHSMHHGGPYPATTSVHFTSVGATSIKRFARPICYQNAPQSLLPIELRDENPRKIWRLVDQTYSRA